MIRLQEIQNALMSVVGWEQGYGDTTLAKTIIEPDITESESGLTFQGAHPLVTLDNVKSIMPANYSEKYPDVTDSSGIFYRGDKVRSNGNYYVCIEDGSANPQDAPEGWVSWNPLNDFLMDLMKRAINTAVQTFIQTKQLNEETKSLLERRTFFDGAARLQAMIDPRGKIVGFEIVPVRAMGVTAKIERIGLQMVHGVGRVRMYLFHSSQFEPIQIEDFNYTNTSGGFQWFTPSKPMYLPYISNGNDAGGAWFLCYNQNDLPDGMRALNVSKDWSAEPCQTCLGGSIESWRQLTKYLQVSPFAISAPENFEENPQMFDIARLGYTNTMNYGLNVEISVGCDLTDFIISQRQIFATVIQKQVAATVLRTIAMNPDVRVNRNQVNVTRDELLYEIDGVSTGRPSGLGYELRQAYKALSLDTRNLDRICLQCNNHGVKYRTV